MKDLHKRVISAVVMLAILIPLVIIGKIPFALGIGFISVLAFLEITSLFKLPNLVKFLSFIGFILIVYNTFDSNMINYGLNYKYLGISLFLVLIPALIYQTKNKYTTDDAFKLYGMLLLIGLGLNFFILIRNLDLRYFILVLLVPMLTDTFAYIGGSLIGKHKFSKISPKKSIEGCLIGSLMGTIIGVIYYANIINYQNNILIIIGIVFLMTLIGQIGDIFFSAIKREYNIKDFSNLIPGHGGILDRLDSLIFVVILFMMCLNYL